MYMDGPLFECELYIILFSIVKLKKFSMKIDAPFSQKSQNTAKNLTLDISMFLTFYNYNKGVIDLYIFSPNIF